MHLGAALELEVDPLDYCAHRFGLGEAMVMERAADWAGLAFAPRIPNTLPGSPIIERIDSLGEIRTVRARLFDREVIYSAPRFVEFLKLRDHAERNEVFRRRFCVVPESAIRAELAVASEETMLDEARQRWCGAGRAPVVGSTCRVARVSPSSPGWSGCCSSHVSRR